MGLIKLPLEILADIAQDLPRKTLHSMSLACHKLHDACNPIIFKDINVQMDLASLPRLRQALDLKARTRGNIHSLMVRINHVEFNAITDALLQENHLQEVWHSFLSCLPELNQVTLEASFWHVENDCPPERPLWQIQSEIWSAALHAGCYFKVDLNCPNGHPFDASTAASLYRPLSRTPVSELVYQGPMQYLMASPFAFELLEKISNLSFYAIDCPLISLSTVVRHQGGVCTIFSAALRKLDLILHPGKPIRPVVELLQACAHTLESIVVTTRPVQDRITPALEVKEVEPGRVVMASLQEIELIGFCSDSRNLMAAIVSPRLLEIRINYWDNTDVAPRDLDDALLLFLKTWPILQRIHLMMNGNEDPRIDGSKGQALGRIKQHLRPGTLMTLDIACFGDVNWMTLIRNATGRGCLRSVMQYCTSLYYDFGDMLREPTPECERISLPHLRELRLLSDSTEKGLQHLHYVLDGLYMPCLHRLEVGICETDSPEDEQGSTDGQNSHQSVPFYVFTFQILAMLPQFRHLHHLMLDIPGSRNLNQNETSITLLRRACVKYDIDFIWTIPVGYIEHDDPVDPEHHVEQLEPEATDNL